MDSSKSLGKLEWESSAAKPLDPSISAQWIPPIPVGAKFKAAAFCQYFVAQLLSLKAIVDFK